MNINNFFICKKMYDIFKKNKEKNNKIIAKY